MYTTNTELYPEKPLEVKAINRSGYVIKLNEDIGWSILDDPDRPEYSASDVWRLLEHIKFLEGGE